MIETEQTVAINVAIDRVWDYVRNIEQWANLMPGLQDCTVIDANASRWTLKVGVGGLVRTVKVLVHVDRWDGPERVHFSYRLEGDPVEGGGTYAASRKNAHETDVALKVRVQGSGPMAPMWEAMGKPILPQLAKAFAGQLKAEIEKAAGATALQSAVTAAPSMVATIAKWLRTVWPAIFRPMGRRDRRRDCMNERNKAVVLKFIEAMGASDAAAAVPLLDPEAFTVVKGFGKFSGVRHYETIVGTIDAFKKLIPTGLRPTIHTVTAEGDRVVVEWEGNAETQEGKPYCNQYCMVFTVRDGRIRQVNEYFCTILADEILWPLVENMGDEIPPS